MVAVKLCGLRTAEGVSAAVAAGADFIGFNFVPWSKRRIDVAQAQKLKAFANTTPIVAVFHNPTVDEVKYIVAKLKLEWIQLHGQEPVAMIAELQKHGKLIKVLTLDEIEDGRAQDYAPHVSAFLIDASTPGRGQTWPWHKLKAHSLPKSYFVAGGLNPENVQAVIKQLQPFGVDTASGIEQNAKEDPARIFTFVKNAKATTQGTIPN